MNSLIRGDGLSPPGRCRLGLNKILSSADALLAMLSARDEAGAVIRRYLPLAIGLPIVYTVAIELLEQYIGFHQDLGYVLLAVLCGLSSVMIVVSLAKTKRALIKLHATEREARSSRQQYKNIVETCMEGIWKINLDRRTTFCNKHMADLLGYAVEEMLGSSLSDFMFAEDFAEARAHMEQQHMNHASWQRELRLKRKDGTPLFVALSASNIIAETGKLVGWMCMCTDNTERRQMLEELRESKRFLEEAQEMGHIGSWSFDLATHQTVWSEQAYKMFGQEPGSTANFETFVSRVHPEDREQAKAWAESIREGAAPSDLQYRVVWSDGTARWIHGRNELLCDAEGKPVRLHGVTQDITERKLAEQQQLDLEKQLRQVQKIEAIGTLAGGIAHDFNNILSAIQGFGEMVLEKLEPGTQLHADQQEVLIGAKRAIELVQHILSFSRQTEFKPVPVIVHDLVKETFGLLRATLPSTIELKRADVIETAAVFGDQTQLHQVLMNLCTNAAHAMEDTGGTLTLGIDLQLLTAASGGMEDGEYVVLKVSDTGSGIPPDVIERIFDPFFTTKEVGRGTGLGLSTVHGIVANLGGSIKVDSEVGHGTTFSIYLPSCKPESALVEERAPAVQGANQRILLIDDEPTLVRLGKEILSRRGYVVTGMSDSLKALEEFRQDPQAYDLVITDETMPQLTGLRMARQMLELRHDLPVILCTGFSQQVTPATAELLGIRKYLHKPVSAHSLSEAVRAVLAA